MRRFHGLIQNEIWGQDPSGKSQVAIRHPNPLPLREAIGPIVSRGRPVRLTVKYVVEEEKVVRTPSPRGGIFWIRRLVS